MRSFSRWWLMLLLSCVHGQQAVLPRSTEQLVQAALPSVVLLVGQRSDGKTSFGSGIIVSRDGKVLTCLHLVRGMTNLRAMRRPRAASGRRSWLRPTWRSASTGITGGAISLTPGRVWKATSSARRWRAEQGAAAGGGE